MAAWQLLENRGLGREDKVWSLERKGLSVGRSSDCDIQILVRCVLIRHSHTVTSGFSCTVPVRGDKAFCFSMGPKERDLRNSRSRISKRGKTRRNCWLSVEVIWSWWIYTLHLQTFINGQLLRNGAVVLRHGDSVRFGYGNDYNVCMVFWCRQGVLTLHIYRTSLIFCGSNFSRIAVFLNFVVIISQTRTAQYAILTIKIFILLKFANASKFKTHEKYKCHAVVTTMNLTQNPVQWYNFICIQIF